MIRRRMDKKFVEFSSREQYDENEDCFENCTKEISSGTFHLNKSEVLWSRDNDSLPENFMECYAGDFSDLTARTTSSSSWHNDEFDMKSTNKVKASLEALDAALYEGIKLPYVSKEVFEECNTWADIFPYLRLKGKQIVKPIEDGIVLYSPTPIQRNSSRYCKSASSCLSVEGKKMTIHVPDRVPSKSFIDNALHEIDDCLEEILEENGEYEELLALDDCCNDKETELATNLSHTHSVQEKIIDRLAMQVWPKVMSMLERFSSKRNHDGDSLHLPVIASIQQSKPLFFQRPRTEGTVVSLTDFPKLSSILSISPKKLHFKKEIPSSTQKDQRPNSEISTSRRNFNTKRNSLNMSKMRNGTSQPTFQRTQKAGDKDSEDFYLFLPALEEDFCSTDALRGTHIEPEMKVSYKPTSSSRMADSSQHNTKAGSFLPPIHDKDYLPTTEKLTRNLFGFYNQEQEVNDSSLTIRSRPGTAISNRDALKFQSTKSTKESHPNECKMKEPFIEEDSNLDSLSTGNKEKHMTLFPIVTSIGPHKEKIYSNIKTTGLVSAFVSGRKR